MLWPAGPAGADQTDPRLDALFERLQAAESRREARPIEQRIWRIWHMHDEEEVLAVMSRGRFYLRQERLERARGAFDQAIELAPEFAEAWNARATVNYMLGNYRESLADIERVLELEPRHFGALSGRGLCWEALDKPEKALTAFEAALEVHPRQPGTRARVRELRDELGLRDI